MTISKILNKTIDCIWCVCKIAYWFVIFGITAWLIFLISKECFYETQGIYHKLFEKDCYCLCVFCLFNVYYFVSKKVRKWKYKILLATLFSVLATGIVFFLNNLWKYYDFNAMFDWVNPLNFTYFLKYDLTYSVGLSEFRYSAMLFGTFALFLALSWLIPKIKRIFSFDNILNVLSILCPPEQEKEGEITCDEFIKGLQDSLENDNIKSELITSINSGDWIKVYDVLIENSNDLLKPEERDVILKRFEIMANQTIENIT